MGNERDDDASTDTVEVTDLRDVWTWTFFLMGATTQGAFVEMPGDPERQKRSRHSALQLGMLVPAIAAALRVAEAHPEEFWQHVKEPIRLEKMKW